MPPEPKPIFVIVAQGGAGDVLCHGPLLDLLVLQSETVVVLATFPEMLAGRPDIVLLSLKPQQDWRNDGRRLWAEVRSGAWRVVHWSGPHPYANWAGGRGRTIAQIIAEAHGFKVGGDTSPTYRPTAGEVAAADVWLKQFGGAPVVLVHRPTQTCFGAKAWDCPEAAPPSRLLQFVQIGSTDEERIPWARSALGMPLRDTAALFFSKHVGGAILGESVFAHIAASSPLGTRAIVAFTCTDPEVFGHRQNTNLSASNGCEHWPCNGPVGGLGSVMPGFLNLTTGKPMSTWCRHERRRCGPSWGLVFETLLKVGGENV